MMEQSLHFSLLLLLSLWAPVPAASLEGSCVEAGISECCDLEVQGTCFAPPTYCLCDPSCREHNDCCDDIDEICAPALPKPLPPALLLTVHQTFHTATLLWTLPLPRDTANQSYTVVYWDYEDPNTTFSHNVSQDMATTAEETVRIILTDLRPGTLYQWMVEARIWTAISASVVSNFTTMPAAKLEILSARLHNSSSVMVSWAHPKLPAGVKLNSFLVHFSATYNDSEIMASSSLQAGWNTSALVVDLMSETFYTFWVQAVVIEEAFMSEDILLSGNITLFVPGSTIVQLRGGPFKQCEIWTEETENEVLKTFRHAVHHAICTKEEQISDYPRDGDLIEWDLVICDDVDSAESHAVYRASLYSSPHLTAANTLSLLQQILGTGSISGLVLDKSCPVAIHRASEPLCHRQGSIRDCQTVQGTASSPQADRFTHNQSCETVCEETMVTVPLLATALVAELFLLIFMGLVIVTAILLVRRRRYLKEEKSIQVSCHNPAQPNQYS